MSENPARVGEEEWSEIQAEGDALWKEYAKLIEQQQPATSEAAQALTDKLYQSIARFWTPSKYSFIGMAHLWNETPEFQTFYAGYHRDLLTYLTEAMTIYAETKLS